ncbi:deoxycytidylate deaminase [Candidatus Contubernalis alkaliaceticus]|uniref:deoxycytidylate deaminase n=1 Tax=Candidatus Contubernalis alkaliaceticus TaxID=338645 RepID=UPI001F4C3709|nr:cytidine/deoxycytidylate deaminase family protein [Candidatus Contubernalis alkalaceticus]UNC93669.1 cytidine deaminase [Candidatus Contubernalis alkalaceticus]
MRPSWDAYFLEVAQVVSTRSNCLRRRVGAIIVKDKRILSTGYNGPPTGMKHCDQVGCLREKMNIPSGERHELCRGLHAEQNAILQGALYGFSVKDSILYVTHQPCILCAKMIINTGLKGIIIKDNYPDDLALELLKEAGISVKIWRSEGCVEWVTP